MVVRVDAEAEAVVTVYRHYERVERRLAEMSVTSQSYWVRRFLAWRAETNRPVLPRLEPVELSEFVVHEARRLSVATMRLVVSSLRSFMRFLFASGVTRRNLSGSVPFLPSLTSWSNAKSRHGVMDPIKI